MLGGWGSERTGIWDDVGVGEKDAIDLDPPFVVRLLSVLAIALPSWRLGSERFFLCSPYNA